MRIRPQHLVPPLLLVGLLIWACTEINEDVSPHPKLWAASHPQELNKSDYDLTPCRGCHGTDLKGTEEVHGCSRTNCHTGGNAIPHPDGWITPANENFHGDWVAAVGMLKCGTCHAEDYSGGSAGVACSNSACHTNGAAIPHPDGWATPGGIFHGDWVPIAGLDNCASCHGQDFSGGLVNVPCSNSSCHTGGYAIPHADGWTISDDPNFHAAWIPSIGLDNCITCHGHDFSGGVAESACSNSNCHTGGDAIPHPDGWTTADHSNFHGDWVRQSGLSSCQVCHGSDFSGGIAEVACSSTSCHTGGNAIPHPSGWTIEEDDDFHGDWVESVGYSACTACHGEDLDGGYVEIACSNTACHTDGDAIPHPDEWDDSGSAAFHGDWVRVVGTKPCATCHSADFSGGFAEVACGADGCHPSGGLSPHPTLAEFINPTHDNYHGRIFWENNFDFSDCQDCHGTNLDGGLVEYSCSATCHTAGVFSCDNCHSGPMDDSFENVRNQTDVNILTVGVHNSHLQAPHAFSLTLDCSECHIVPDSMWALGHIDDTPYAEVTFGSLATANDSLDAVWEHTTAGCDQIYCHGSFVYGSVVGNERAWTWTEPVTGDLCGTCHGLPPTGHITGAGIERCGEYCHSNIVSHVDHRTIKNKILHINGENDFIQD